MLLFPSNLRSGFPLSVLSSMRCAAEAAGSTWVIAHGPLIYSPYPSGEGRQDFPSSKSLFLMQQNMITSASSAGSTTKSTYCGLQQATRLIKFIDVQVTRNGVLMNLCFLSIFRARLCPLPPVSFCKCWPGSTSPWKAYQKSARSPKSSTFIGSVLGQFVFQIPALIYISSYVYRTETRSSDIDLEGDFEPSLVNSAVYLLQLIQKPLPSPSTTRATLSATVFWRACTD